MSDDCSSGKLEKEKVSNFYEIIILCMQKAAVFSIYSQYMSLVVCRRVLSVYGVDQTADVNTVHI